jgi:hypothetical protein
LAPKKTTPDDEMDETLDATTPEQVTRPSIQSADQGDQEDKEEIESKFFKWNFIVDISGFLITEESAAMF